MRHLNLIRVRLCSCFNPRICKRCDSRLRAFMIRALVSIHASVKDATYPAILVVPPSGVSIHASVKDATFISTIHNYTAGFNPRICKRCDSTPNFKFWLLVVSIHASVKDATESNGFLNLSFMSFNPRICKRCDI